ncbi:MAG: DUF4012 domain-containing protein [bacterium]|nr:DUF4012 domain-containing protein [bacterium]
MPTLVPHKNIEPILMDIRRPGATRQAPVFRSIVHLERSPEQTSRFAASASRRTARRVVFAVLTALIVGLSTGTWWSLHEVQRLTQSLSGRGDIVAQNFILALEALTAFKPGEAHAYLVNNEQAMKDLSGSLGVTERAMLNVAGGMVPAIKASTAIFGSAAKLNEQFLDLSSLLMEFQAHGLVYFQSDGERLLVLFGRIRASIADISATTKELKNSTASLRGASSFVASLDDELGEHYLKRAADLYQVEQFLDALLAFLSSDSDRHFLILFQNPAELRPGGGFIGSYADLTIRRGQLANLDVRDIYDPDGQLALNVTPPTPLRTLTERWGARDANWFFDFPTSARTVLGLLESSKMYSERHTTFEGALALNIDIVKTILGAVGPIKLPDYTFTVTADNFLSEVQREVETGADNKAGHPKRILSVLTPIILERLNSLSPEAHMALLDAFGAHLTRKDIMVYMKDPTLATYFAARGVDGAVYTQPTGFWGSYVGVVDANVAGGKSDAFITQTIDARIDVDTDGGVLTDLAVTRAHAGDKQKDPWWRTTNQNYLQVYTLPGSTLVGLSGNDVKTMVTAESEGNDFTANTDLDRIERTTTFLASENAWSLQAFGKQVFATWFNVAAGKRKTLEVRYQTPDTTGEAVVPGRQFTFVFDRQSGVKTSLRAAILAPIGYEWAEARGSAFVIEEPDPPARIETKLTLVKQL